MPDAIEIPREGDLKDAPQTARDELLLLRTAIHDTPDATDDSRKMLDAAIRSGSRTEVVRALQTLQTRTEFGRLRDRIEANRLSVSSNGLGLMDQGIVRGEQGARYLYNNWMPNWLKLGAITGGATWLTSRLLWIPTRLFGGKEAGDGMLKWGNTAALAIGGVAAAGKAVTDVVTSRTSTADALLRQVPGGGVLFNINRPEVNIQERIKRVSDRLATTAWKDDTTVEFPDLSNAPPPAVPDFPIIHPLQIEQYEGERLLGRANLPGEVPGTTVASRQRVFAPNVTRIDIKYRLTGVDAEQTVRINK